MNDKNLMSSEEKSMAEMLEAAAQHVDISPSFKKDLEKKLMNSHEPKAGLGSFSVKRVASTIGWTIGLAAMTLMFIWVIRTIAPQPQPAAGNTPFPNVETATPESVTPEKTQSKDEAYDFNGTTLYLNAPFPETPKEIKIYTTKDEVFATVDNINALAAQFGIKGEIYQIPGDTPSTNNYLIVDGNQQLRVRSDQYFTYYPDYAGELWSSGIYNDYPNAEALIKEFMQTHGFNFEYKVERSQSYGAYVALPLTPDGFVLHHEQFKLSGMMFYFNKDGIASVDARLLKYDEVATVSIISAQDAFQKLLDPIAGSGAGTLMGMSSGGISDKSWQRIFPLDKTITYFGYISSTGKSITGGAPLITLDRYIVTGNTEGLTENMQSVYIEAKGQFHNTDGIKIFEIQSWTVRDGFDEGYQGTIQREGEQTVINTTDGKTLILPDMPSDVPLPLVDAYIMGVTQGDTFEWKSFDTRLTNGGGGGGGGGLGFYKLNLSGTPVPFPTPEPTQNPTGAGGNGYAYVVVEGDTLAKIADAFAVSLADLLQANGISEDNIYIGQTIIIPSANVQGVEAGQRVEGLRGIFTVNIYHSPNNSQRVEYGFILNSDETSFPYMFLEGSELDKLTKYHNRPIDIWGVIDHIDEYGRPVIKVDRYEIPYPDMKIQILQGTQENIEIDGKVAVLFTTNDGKKYIQLSPGGALMMDAEIDPTQPQLFIEVLEIPNETYAGYLAIRYFSGGFAFNPQDGTPIEYEVTVDQPYVFEEAPDQNYTPPTLTIENVELVYYIPDPRYITSELVMDQRYLQPVWRFHGHYSNGDEFEYLIQALKDEFLLPELAPYTQPG